MLVSSCQWLGLCNSAGNWIFLFICYCYVNYIFQLSISILQSFNVNLQTSWRILLQELKESELTIYIGNCFKMLLLSFFEFVQSKLNFIY